MEVGGLLFKKGAGAGQIACKQSKVLASWGTLPVLRMT